MNKISTILVATQNAGKAKEIRELLKDIGVEVVWLAAFPWLPDCLESGRSFAENARQKARFYSRITGLPTLGDDSGLVVDALGGAPGVYSARYAGEGASDTERISKLLSELAATGSSDRRARFVCAVSLVWHERELIALEERCEGEIINTPRGSGGFGYDPVFLVPDFDKTFAELNPAEKNNISHRGRALVLFRERLKAI